jgi:hypothetical protein
MLTTVVAYVVHNTAKQMKAQYAITITSEFPSLVFNRDHKIHTLIKLKEIHQPNTLPSSFRVKIELPVNVKFEELLSNGYNWNKSNEKQGETLYISNLGKISSTEPTKILLALKVSSAVTTGDEQIMRASVELGNQVINTETLVVKRIARASEVTRNVDIDIIKNRLICDKALNTAKIQLNICNYKLAKETVWNCQSVIQASPTASYASSRQCISELSDFISTIPPDQPLQPVMPYYGGRHIPHITTVTNSQGVSVPVSISTPSFYGGRQQYNPRTVPPAVLPVKSTTPVPKTILATKQSKSVAVSAPQQLYQLFNSSPRTALYIYSPSNAFAERELASILQYQGTDPSDLALLVVLLTDSLTSIPSIPNVTQELNLHSLNLRKFDILTTSTDKVIPIATKWIEKNK